MQLIWQFMCSWLKWNNQPEARFILLCIFKLFCDRTHKVQKSTPCLLRLVSQETVLQLPSDGPWYDTPTRNFGRCIRCFSRFRSVCQSFAPIFGCNCHGVKLPWKSFDWRCKFTMIQKMVLTYLILINLTILIIAIIAIGFDLWLLHVCIYCNNF